VTRCAGVARRHSQLNRRITPEARVAERVVAGSTNIGARALYASEDGSPTVRSTRTLSAEDSRNRRDPPSGHQIVTAAANNSDAKCPKSTISRHPRRLPTRSCPPTTGRLPGNACAPLPIAHSDSGARLSQDAHAWSSLRASPPHPGRSTRRSPLPQRQTAHRDRPGRSTSYRRNSTRSTGSPTSATIRTSLSLVLSVSGGGA
jgi:hypothetical protein